MSTTPSDAEDAALLRQIINLNLQIVRVRDGRVRVYYGGNRQETGPDLRAVLGEVIRIRTLEAMGFSEEQPVTFLTGGLRLPASTNS